jgi:hypothetical protein
MPSGWSGRLCRLYPIFSKMWSVTLLFASPVITSVCEKGEEHGKGSRLRRGDDEGRGQRRRRLPAATRGDGVFRVAFAVFADCALASGEMDKSWAHRTRRTLALDDDGLGDGGARQDGARLGNDARAGRGEGVAKPETAGHSAEGGRATTGGAAVRDFPFDLPERRCARDEARRRREVRTAPGGTRASHERVRYHAASSRKGRVPEGRHSHVG